MTPDELRASPAVFVDLETTGFSVDHDRAIELAAIRFEDGRETASLCTLLRPAGSIPARVSRLTGISDAMVREAPTLEQILPDLCDLLDGAVLVAHNLIFDYGFLRRAATIARIELAPPRVCTLRLARRALPGLKSYSLDALSRQFSLPVERLHRAEPHARVAARLYVELLGAASDQVLLECLEHGSISSRPRVTDAMWKELPAGPGVYLLKDGEGHVVYVGKSTNVRRRVREHLRQRWHPQPRLRRELSRVAQVEGIETDSEVEALFLESRLIKRYQPDGNSAERRERMAAFVAVNRHGALPTISVVDAPDKLPGTVHGPFGSRARLESGLRALFDSVGLCVAGDPERCHPVIPRHCLGPCGLARSASEYALAVDSALALLRGEDQGLLDYLRQRRDHEADGLNFEVAAALRDRIFALEQLVGDERWLRDVRAMHAVLILPAEQPDLRKLVFLRGTRLAATERVSAMADQAELELLMRSIYQSPSQQPAAPREVAEEMRLIQGWMRRLRGRQPLVSVDADRLGEAAEALAVALRNPTSVSIV